MESVLVCPVDEEKVDKAIVADASVLSEGGMEDSNQKEVNENDVVVEEEEEEEEEEDDDDDSSVACAVVISEEAENENTLNQTILETITTIKTDDADSVQDSSSKARKRKRDSTKKDGGVPSIKDLFIPCRATKRIMKLDPDIATVQNEAAVVTTYALELFIKKIVHESYLNAKKRGRNTVK